MTSAAAQRYALIAQIVHDYKSVSGRTAGKKAIQKLVYVLQQRAKDAQFYRFSFYNYGVYSQDLARDIADAERYDFINVSYDAHANAYSIEPSENFAYNSKFLPSSYNAEYCKDALPLSPRELELITTIMFVRDEEKLPNEDSVVKRVLELKPKFEEHEVLKQMPHFCDC